VRRHQCTICCVVPVKTIKGKVGDDARKVKSMLDNRVFMRRALKQVMYSLRSIILVAGLDASIHKICLDTSKFATKIVQRRGSIFLLTKFNLESPTIEA
jgi:hypothetical protein